MIYVAAGVCQMQVDGHGVFELGPGDSLAYAAETKHRWRQVSDGPICVLLIQENVESVPLANSHSAPQFVSEDLNPAPPGPHAGRG